MLKNTIMLCYLLADVLSIDAEWDRPIHNIVIDSREVKAGDLFVACTGTQVSGCHYISDAIRRGAVAVLVDVNEYAASAVQNTIPIFAVKNLVEQLGYIAARFYQYPSRQLQVIGVTGTNGKTSCTHFIAKALQATQKTAGVIGTLGNGLVTELQPTTHTTPQTVMLQKLLADLLQQGAQTVAMEVSSHGLDQGRVNGVDFAVGVFTNLTRDHLDYHLDMESYAKAKRRLFEPGRIQHAVINADDVCGQQWLAELPALMPVVGYTTGKIPSKLKGLPFVSASNIMLGRQGIRAKVHTPWGQGILQSPLLGRFNLSNLLAALTTLGVLQIPLQDALDALAQLRGVAGRMETFGGEQRPLVVVDYAHTPDALEKVLTALREHCVGQLWCVFGCGGDRDRGKRPLMGEIAERYADQVIITDDNPRTESPQHIVGDIIQGLSTHASVVVEHDRRRAIAHAVACAKSGDIVLIAGKGHELYQQVGEKKLPFSDALTVRLLLESK